jgi:DNA invertase Pin-like site-specific DNA recombinase
MNTSLKSITRCAVYTRKSCEEGLEQSFNSLDAQREACEAFIVSQRHEGWRVLPHRYDDGGYSGGNLERPGLKQLLDDVAANKIDTIVVYKVDRLTRSLADFAKIIEALDAQGASFVSVTQQFNTTTSMGRLTLNILLSFAQFEREVTGERIRDKIAASKRRGMWMGGFVPIGYNAIERKLIVNSDEAKTVDRIFSGYLEAGSVRGLKVRLDAEGVKSKVRTSASGKRSGGSSLSRGAVYKILNNHIYLGEISHKGQCHQGQHEPIIPRDLWNKVQTQLRSDNQGRRRGVKVEAPSLLRGLIQDGESHKLTASHTVKNGRRYRYYCQAVTQQGTNSASSIRLPAHDIESRVVARIADFLQSGDQVIDQLGTAEDNANVIQQLLGSAADSSQVLKTSTLGQISDLVRRVIDRVVVHRDRVQILLNKKELRGVLLNERPAEQFSGQVICLEFAASLARRGREVRLVVPSSATEVAPAYQLQALLKAIARAHDWSEQIISGQASGPRAIARRSGLDESYVRRVLGYAFLAPDIVEMILDGRQPHCLTLEKLKGRVQMSWAEQRGTILRPASAGRAN